MAGWRRWGAGAVVVALALMAGACGSDDPAEGAAPTTASPPPSEWAAAELVDLPDGLSPRLAEEVQGERRIGYNAAPGDLFDRSVMVATSDPAAMPLDRIVEESAPMTHPPVETEVRGHRALLGTLTDEGRVYGYQLTWDERPDLRIVVEDARSEADGAVDASPDTVRELTDHLRGLTDAEWQARLVGLGVDGRLGRIDPASTVVEAGRGEIDGDDWVLEAHVPPGYPLGEFDQRVTCLELTYRGESSGVQCQFLPGWGHLGGQELVYGTVPSEVAEVVLRPSDGESGFEPFTVATTEAAAPAGTRVFVTAMPAGACSADVVTSDGAMVGFTAPREPSSAPAGCR